MKRGSVTVAQVLAMSNEDFEKWDSERSKAMGNSTKTKGGKGAPVPISMHPTKGGGHPTGGMGGNVGSSPSRKGGGGRKSK